MEEGAGWRYTFGGLVGSNHSQIASRLDSCLSASVPYTFHASAEILEFLNHGEKIRVNIPWLLRAWDDTYTGKLNVSLLIYIGRYI